MGIRILWEMHKSIIEMGLGRKTTYLGMRITHILMGINSDRQQCYRIQHP